MVGVGARRRRVGTGEPVFERGERSGQVSDAAFDGLEGEPQLVDRVVGEPLVLFEPAEAVVAWGKVVHGIGDRRTIELGTGPTGTLA